MCNLPFFTHQIIIWLSDSENNGCRPTSYFLGEKNQKQFPKLETPRQFVGLRSGSPSLSHFIVLKLYCPVTALHYVALCLLSINCCPHNGTRIFARLWSKNLQSLCLLGQKVISSLVRHKKMIRNMLMWEKPANYAWQTSLKDCKEQTEGRREQRARNKARSLLCDAQASWQLSETKAASFLCSAETVWNQQGSRYESLLVCSLLFKPRPIFHWFFFSSYFCDKAEDRFQRHHILRAPTCSSSSLPAGRQSGLALPRGARLAGEAAAVTHFLCSMWSLSPHLMIWWNGLSCGHQLTAAAHKGQLQLIDAQRT